MEGAVGRGSPAAGDVGGRRDLAGGRRREAQEGGGVWGSRRRRGVGEQGGAAGSRGRCGEQGAMRGAGGAAGSRVRGGERGSRFGRNKCAQICGGLF
ncbi:hypothetical protein GUJ93_ZPchr0009g1324 [Zizania palustris]|uniref:Uncharacterized protein n=1 Tax=Zizania palustris TaxID=103762 RepID=A0A8J5S5Z9_ZIZPA|nr:hypothetical protein GUJ93_ZPchr0009g1324 [Zizania palustris]